MSERRNVNARLLFIVLLLVNVGFFGYVRFNPDDRAAAFSRIQNLQINPGRIQLMGSASRGPGGQLPKAACLEWGPFAASEAPAAQAALVTLQLKQPPIQRMVGEADGARRVSYFIREPEPATVARIADLQRTFPATSIRAGPCPS